jgi:hypothetical protein
VRLARGVTELDRLWVWVLPQDSFTIVSPLCNAEYAQDGAYSGLAF